MRPKANHDSDSFGARYYDARLGRFLTPDWSATPEATPYASLANPQTPNPYVYVLNSPTTSTDPDGHWCIFATPQQLPIPADISSMAEIAAAPATS